MSYLKDETTMEYIRRAVGWLNVNHESMLDELPTIDSAFELFDLISDTYDASTVQEVYECISNGEDPKPLNDFIAKHDIKHWLNPIQTEEST